MRVTFGGASVALVLMVVIGCDGPTAVTPKSGTEQANRIAIVDPDDLVPTPEGLRPRACVHQVENGARVDRNDVVHRHDGSTYQLPKCPSSAAQPAPTDTGWVENTYTSNILDGATTFRKLTATWSVPTLPAGQYTSSSELYNTFPGLESNTGNGTTSYILQPVLTAYGANFEGGNAWEISSWHCDNGTNCKFAGPNTAYQGDVISGSVTASNCANGSCLWTVITRDVTGGWADTLNIEDLDNYTLATSGAVEVKNLPNCDNFPRDGVFYTNVALYDQNLDLVNADWLQTVTNPSPNCGLSITSGYNYANLYHESDPVSSVAVPAHTLTAGSSVQLAPASYDASGTRLYGLPAYSYSNNNTTVASVSATGLVTALKAGTAVMTASQPPATPGTLVVNGTGTMTVEPAGSVSGPSTINSAGNYTWTVSGSGCNTTCTYQWQELQVDVSGGWFNAGTATTKTQNVQGAYGDFELRAIITSNGQSYTTPSLYVTNNIGGGCNPDC
jgi:hypothetical protein